MLRKDFLREHVKQLIPGAVPSGSRRDSSTIEWLRAPATDTVSSWR